MPHEYLKKKNSPFLRTEGSLYQNKPNRRALLSQADTCHREQQGKVEGGAEFKAMRSVKYYNYIHNLEFSRNQGPVFIIGQ